MNKLGFGFLRIPKRGEEYDFARMYAVVDAAMARGCTYFDTAYSYLNGQCEEWLRKILVERYPRERFRLATKMAGYLVREKEDCRRQLEEQKMRLGVEYFDVYMLHWLNAKHYAIAQQFDQFGFLRSIKESGEARAIGFSYHDTPELLDEILTAHPEVDYVMLQINYLDWNSASVQSRACYETAVRHGKKVIVMEPIKGGALASLPAEAEAMLRPFDPAAPASSFALRFAQSLPQVELVLSGMNDVAQVEENCRDFTPLTQAEFAALEKVAQLLRSSSAVQCTACGYCVSHCPQAIAIPEYFKLYNELQRSQHDGWKVMPVYEQLRSRADAADCIACGQCSSHCPQHLAVPDLLTKARQALDTVPPR